MVLVLTSRMTTSKVCLASWAPFHAGAEIASGKTRGRTQRDWRERLGHPWCCRGDPLPLERQRDSLRTYSACSHRQVEMVALPACPAVAARKTQGRTARHRPLQRPANRANDLPSSWRVTDSTHLPPSVRLRWSGDRLDEQIWRGTASVRVAVSVGVSVVAIAHARRTRLDPSCSTDCQFPRNPPWNPARTPGKNCNFPPTKS